MIFALFIIMMFLGMLAFVQFGMQTNVESPRAQLYAQNMSVWHQAAMLELQQSPPPMAPCISPSPTLCPAVPVNSFWTGGGTQAPRAGRAMALAWPEYKSMVISSNTSGWQSFFLRNIQLDGTSAQGTSYMLTIFRGFGGRNEDTGHRAGTDKGSVDETNMVKNLARNVTERVGIGALTCTDTQCSFERYSSEIVPDLPGITRDTRVIIGTDIFTDMPTAADWFPATGTAGAGSPQAVREALQGRPAILTRADTN